MKLLTAAVLALLLSPVRNTAAAPSAYAGSWKTPRGLTIQLDEAGGKIKGRALAGSAVFGILRETGRTKTKVTLALSEDGAKNVRGTLTAAPKQGGLEVVFTKKGGKAEKPELASRQPETYAWNTEQEQADITALAAMIAAVQAQEAKVAGFKGFKGVWKKDAAKSPGDAGAAYTIQLDEVKGALRGRLLSNGALIAILGEVLNDGGTRTLTAFGARNRYLKLIVLRNWNGDPKADVIGDDGEYTGMMLAAQPEAWAWSKTEEDREVAAFESQRKAAEAEARKDAKACYLAQLKDFQEAAMNYKRKMGAPMPKALTAYVPGYLKEIPAEPFTHSASVVATADGKGGWVFSPESGQVKLNLEGNGPDGQPYWTY